MSDSEEETEAETEAETEDETEDSETQTVGYFDPETKTIVIQSGEEEEDE